MGLKLGTGEGETVVGANRWHRAGGGHDTVTERSAPPTPREPVELEIVLDDAAPRDLAPEIFRQRLVIEGTCRRAVTADDVSRYLKDLSTVCGMRTLIEPVTHRSEKYGWAGWIHWETSGAHLYAWDHPLFFSVDVYTCKAFDAPEAVHFTRVFFDAPEIIARTF